MELRLGMGVGWESINVIEILSIEFFSMGRKKEKGPEQRKQ